MISTQIAGSPGFSLDPTVLAALLCAISVVAFSAGAAPKDADARAGELLARMTLDEKIGQMAQADLLALQGHLADIQKYGLGSVLSGGGSDPAPDNTAQSWLKAVQEHQSWALKTRLQIPLLYGIDAVHGNNNVIGAVVFPHNIGLGASRNPTLVRQAARITALETAAVGIRWAFAPCVAVAQDPRWGRTYESFGSEPGVAGEMGAAAVIGLQGDTLSGDPSSVLACAKHFAGDGGTRDGKDQGDTICDEAIFRSRHLAPYLPAIRAGAGSIMVSYSSWNGTKMHGNKHLLTDVLKGELAFQGFVVSDWAAIDQLSPDYEHAIEVSINAGLDMAMIPNGPGRTNNYVEFVTKLKELVAEGRVPQSRIDDAVRRILRVKFQMGLFEHPLTDPALVASIGSAEHRAVARECVRQSLVLLKNAEHTLPLAKTLKRLVVVGEAADDLAIQCGGWTIGWQGAKREEIRGGTTILAAMRKALPDTSITFSPDAANLQGAEVVLAVIGEQPYAEMNGDRPSLALPPADLALLQKVKGSGARVVTVLVSGRPRVLGSALEVSDAFVAAWLPGTEGQGIADVLAGAARPVGKLPRPWPASDSQLTESQAWAFPFGFGLTY
jgi:beta-glucosidase